MKGITINVEVRIKVKRLTAANTMRSGDTLYTFTNGLPPFFGDLEENINLIRACGDEWKALLSVNLKTEFTGLDTGRRRYKPEL